MSDYQTFVGIDVSKAQLDLTIAQGLEVCSQDRIKNNQKAIEKYLKKMAKQYALSEALFCMEATGMYINHLVAVLSLKQWATWVENPIEIKRSLGLQRGKNDKVDAQRIAEYAFRFQDKIRLYEPSSQTITQLQTLDNLRTNLVETRKRWKTNYQENKQFMDKASFEILKKHSLPTLMHLEKQIKNIEKQLQQVMAKDEELKEIYQIVKSVTGVGKVTATAVLIATQGFRKFKQANKFACYCGVVPFEHSSGKFKSKEKVSKMANKRLKTLYVCHECHQTKGGTTRLLSTGN